MVSVAKKVGLVAVLSLLAACANRSRLAGVAELSEARALKPPPPGSALLYVVRASDGAVGYGHSVSVDGVLQGFMSSGDFFRLVLPPGAHQVELRGQNGVNDDAVQTATVSARAGDVFYTGPYGTRGAPLQVLLDDGSAPDRSGWTSSQPTIGQLKGALQGCDLLLPEGAGGAARVAVAAPGAAGAVLTKAAVASAGGLAPSPAPPGGAAPPTAGLPASSSSTIPPPTAFAVGAAQPTSFALVIGVERYRDLPPPTGARGDAQRFAELAKKTLGVPERNVILALDDRAAKSDLEKHLAWLETNVPAGGRIYLFFAGHGAPDPASGTSYLLPYDADPGALSGTALKLSDVTARLGRTKASEVVAFLDSCFSGTGGRSVIAAGTRPLVPVQKLEAAPKVSVLAAVTGAQTSGAYAGGGGLFSHYLLDALGSGKADHDGDGQITLGEVHDWLRLRVANDAKRDSREQSPSLTPGVGVDPSRSVLATGVVER